MQFLAPDDGRKSSLKIVQRLTEINKLRNVASCWLYSEKHPSSSKWQSAWALCCSDQNTRTERTCVEVDSVFTLTAEKETHSSVTESTVVKVRRDCAKFKGEIFSHHTKWRLQVGADTDEGNGSSNKVVEERIVEFQIAAQGKEEIQGSVSGRPWGSGKFNLLQVERVASCW